MAPTPHGGVLRPLFTGAVVAALAGVLLHYCLREFREPPAPGSVVLVSGASSGIGRDAALTLACTHGYTVLAGVRKDADGDSIEAHARALCVSGNTSGSLKAIRLDVTSAADVAAAVRDVHQLEAQGLELAAVVNNAGVSGIAPFEHTTDETDMWIMNVNYHGARSLTRAMLPALTRAKGRVVCVTSVAGFLPVTWMASYTASKHALDGMCSVLRREMGPEGVSVSIVEPGAIETAMHVTLFDGPAATGTDDAAAATGDASGAGVGVDDHGAADADSAKWGRYAPRVRGFQASRELVGATSVDSTTVDIVEAVTSPYPHARYQSGWDSHAMQVFAYALPDRLVDWIFGAMEQHMQ